MTARYLKTTILCLVMGFATHDVRAMPRPYTSLRGHKPAGAAAFVVETANQNARVRPDSTTFLNAEQVFAFSGGALFQVYTSPGKVTDIILERGEHLVGTGPVAAGDTARWIIGTTESGAGISRQVHILVKPTQLGLTTNLVVNTDRRTYHIELKTLASTYMASVSWRYAEDALLAVTQTDTDTRSQVPVEARAQTIDPVQLNFAYRLSGDHVDWRPLRCFDDGRKLYIEMPAGQSALPPLFGVKDDGTSELINYRVQGRYLVVDRLLSQAALRMGDKGHLKVVRILRVAGEAS